MLTERAWRVAQCGRDDELVAGPQPSVRQLVRIRHAVALDATVRWPEIAVNV